ncbi:MAG: archaeosortase/exosortase family protein, partial [Acidobacteriota bacterium]|nr:archaeosortase/exosortase family protein [Acidobacteriota bacterium]
MPRPRAAFQVDASRWRAKRFRAGPRAAPFRPVPADRLLEDAMPPSDTPQHHWWKPLLVASSVAFVYWGVMVRLAHFWWEDENYSHGLLIPFVIGYILWTERDALARTPQRPSVGWGAAAVVAALLTLFAIRVAIRPADSEHHYGHGKAEHLGALAESAVLLGVALLIGGHETTLNQLSNFSYLLLTHPDQLATLRARPELLPQAIEELL